MVCGNKGRKAEGLEEGWLFICPQGKPYGGILILRNRWEQFHGQMSPDEGLPGTTSGPAVCFALPKETTAKGCRVHATRINKHAKGGEGVGFGKRGSSNDWVDEWKGGWVGAWRSK